MKKALAILMVALLGMALFGCTTETGGSDGDKVIKIGVYEPASGMNGSGGKQETLGMEYANSVLNTVEIGGETYKIVLEIVDNESSTDKGPTAAASLVSANCAIVLGSFGSAVSIAASDVFADAGIPVIGATCTNPQVTEGNSHYFRICFLDPFQGTVLANFAVEELQVKKAYCLAQLGDDYSVGLCNYFMEAFKALGGEVVYETFPEGNSDYSSYLTTAANQGCEVFFAPVSTESAALIIDQAAAQNLAMPILAGDTWDNPVIVPAAQGKNVEIYVTTFFDEGDDSEAGKAFVQGFKAWLNANPQKLTNNGGTDMVAAVSAMGYDTYMVAVEAIKKANSANPADILAVLSGVTYTGVTGAIAFDEIGDAIRDLAFIKKVNTQTNSWDFIAIQGVN